MLRSKLHRPWQPRMREAGILNPFAHTTEPEAGLVDHRDNEQLDQIEDDSEAAEAPKTTAGSGSPR
jgi:hypothetical protein